MQELRQDLGSLLCARWCEREWIDRIDAQSGRIHNPLPDAIRTHLDDIGGCADRDLIKAIAAVQDYSMLDAQPLKSVRHGAHEHGMPHPDHLPARTSGVREGTNEVEKCGEWQCAPRGDGMSRSRVMLDREAEAEPDLLQHGGLREARTRQVETQCLQHLSAATTGAAAIAVLGRVHAAGCGHQSSAGAGVEGLWRAAGASGIEDGRWWKPALHRARHFAHGQGGAHDLVDRWGACREQEQELGDLDIRAASLHDQREGGMRLVLAQVMARAQALDGLTQQGWRAWSEGVVVDGWHGGRGDPNDHAGTNSGTRGKFGGVSGLNIRPRSNSAIRQGWAANPAHTLILRDTANSPHADPRCHPPHARSVHRAVHADLWVALVRAALCGWFAQRVDDHAGSRQAGPRRAHHEAGR